jgi:hypothetical protein
MRVDRASLGFLGLVFGGITAAVMMLAFTVVLQHVDGRLTLETEPVAIIAAR